MESINSLIKKDILNYRELEIIDAQKFYEDKWKSVPETTFYKTFSRLDEIGDLKRIAKGVYCKPRKGRFGIVLPNEKNILDHYLGKERNKGVLRGYRLYNKLGLTTQISKTIGIYSTEIVNNTKSINEVKINKINITLNDQTIRLIELLEVLQNFRKIEDLNSYRFKSVMKDSIKSYTDHSLDQILQAINYKKSTIASLQVVLNHFGVANGISKHLNSTSFYKTINMEAFDETTQ